MKPARLAEVSASPSPDAASRRPPKPPPTPIIYAVSYSTDRTKPTFCIQSFWVAHWTQNAASALVRISSRTVRTNEIKLKRNWEKRVSKLFCFSQYKTVKQPQNVSGVLANPSRYCTRRCSATAAGLARKKLIATVIGWNKTISKQFWNCFISVLFQLCGQFNDEGGWQLPATRSDVEIMTNFLGVIGR